jgi:hypothetical protein
MPCGDWANGDGSGAVWGLWKAGVANSELAASRPGDLDALGAFSYPLPPMKRHLPWTLCACVVALCFAVAEDLALSPRNGVLLLNNGELIEGTITAAGDRYDVNKEGGEIYIKRSDVAVVGRDAHDCYVHKRAGIEQGRAADHLDLAEWCLKNNLLPQAEQEIAAARAADAGHPKIRLLEARLKVAQEGPKNSPPTASAEKTTSPEQLDTMVRTLPAGSMESFTTTIQPMLLNYCAKSGCHGPRSANALRLERIAPNRLAGRHPTQRNLQSVLTMVDRQQPEDSKLLQAPIRPHGSTKGPIFTDREQAQYKQLVQWVYQVANAKESSARPTLEERGAPLLQAVPHKGRPPIVEPAEIEPARPKAARPAQDWSENFPDQSAGRAGQPESLIQPPRSACGVTAINAPREPADKRGDFVPKDAFDPEIFNRRFFGK